MDHWDAIMMIPLDLDPASGQLSRHVTIAAHATRGCKTFPLLHPSIVSMSQNPPTDNSSSNYQVIFDNALKAYKTKTGKDLKSDPLFHRLESCNSPDAVLTLLRQQINGLGQSGSGDERLTNWINPVVNVLYNFSGTIGGAVSLVSFDKFILPRAAL
jgi:hypothetical protein